MPPEGLEPEEQSELSANSPPDGGDAKAHEPASGGSSEPGSALIVIQSAENNFQRLRNRLNPILARTFLDAEACRQVVVRAVIGQEKILEERTAAGGTEAPKVLEPLRNVRKATPCEAQWEKMPGGEYFRLCTECKLYVYDLRTLERTDAEDLVFQREGRQNVNFYRRKDGRYLTQDCTVAVQRAIRILTGAGLGTLAVVGVAVLLMLAPRPKYPSAQQTAARTSAVDSLDDDDDTTEANQTGSSSRTAAKPQEIAEPMTQDEAQKMIGPIAPPGIVNYTGPPPDKVKNMQNIRTAGVAATDNTATGNTAQSNQSAGSTTTTAGSATQVQRNISEKSAQAPVSQPSAAASTRSGASPAAPVGKGTAKDAHSAGQSAPPAGDTQQQPDAQSSTPNTSTENQYVRNYK